MQALKISHALDRKVIRADSVSQLNLLVGFTGRSIIETDIRPPLNIIAALDFSGSMRGEPVQALRETMLCIIDHLAASDRLTVIAFDAEPVVLAQAESMTEENRERLKTVVAGKETGAGTNIYDAIRTGYQYARGRDMPKNTINRMVLLTDGQPSFGRIEADEIIKLASGSPNGLSISTFGSGEHHDEFILQAISNVSGGNYYYIQPDAGTRSRVSHKKAIAQAFGAEFGGLLSCVARNIRCAVKVPDGFKILRLFDYASQDKIVEIPDVYADETRYAGFKIEAAPVKKPGLVRLAEITVGYYDLLGNRQETGTIKATVKFAKPGNEQMKFWKRLKHYATSLVKCAKPGDEQMKPNMDVMIQARVLEAAEMLEYAILLADNRNLERARPLVENAIEHLKPLLEIGGKPVQEMDRLLKETLKAMNSMEEYVSERKECTSVCQSYLTGRAASQKYSCSSINSTQESLTRLIMNSEGHFSQHVNLNAWQCRCGRWGLPGESKCRTCGRRRRAQG